MKKLRVLLSTLFIALKWYDISQKTSASN